MTHDRFWDLILDKAKVFGLYLMLILVPISYTAGDIRQFQEKILVMAGMSYASLFFGSIWMTLFFFLNIGLYVWNGCEVGGGQIINIFIGCLLFSASRSFFSNRSINILVNSLKILILLNLFWMSMQSLRIDPIFLAQSSLGEVQWGLSYNGLSGLMNYQSAMGMFFCLTIPFLFCRGIVLPILMLIPAYFSKSSAVYLGCMISIIYGLFYIRMITFKKKIFYILLLIAAIGAGAYGISRDISIDTLTGNSRYENWHLYFKTALSKPLFGYGPDSFRNFTPHKPFYFSSDENYNPLIMMKQPDGSLMAKYHSANEGKRIERFKGKMPKTFADWVEAHNEYIQMFFEYGLAGILLIGAFCYEIFRRFRLSMEIKEVRVLFGALLCYLAFSTTQFPLHLARIVVFLPIILGAFFAYTDKDWDMFVKGGA